ncbi:VOC family protein [Actinopolymorpha alba]|uniref:VOC family protein n=1 Tax=Actinopolymorpha alba TaxID=533267 RepID=UPI00036181B6|nr:VOC family protein [Actinopolymorpha alba]
MRVRIQEIMIDCHNPATLARFWADLMKCRWGSIDERLAVVEAEPVRLTFQRVPESKQVKNRLHLDVQVADADEACARAIDLGAQRSGQQQLDDASNGYVGMLDPEGNEFCFVVDNAGGWEQLATEALAQNDSRTVTASSTSRTL